jgi:hypothetical protein
MRVMLVIAAVLLAGCGEPKSDAPTPTVAASQSQPPARSAVNVSELQQIAEQACLCARSGGGGESCWKSFNDKVRAHEEGVPVGTACAPVSTSLRCFDDETADRFCIVTGHHLVGSDLPQLCTDREVKIVETAFYEVVERTDDYKQAKREAERVMKALMRGEPLPLPTSPKGCGA